MMNSLKETGVIPHYAASRPANTKGCSSPGWLTNDKGKKSARDGAAAAEGETPTGRCAAELRP